MQDDRCPFCGHQTFYNGCSASPDTYRAVCEGCGSQGPEAADWWDAVKKFCNPAKVRKESKTCDEYEDAEHASARPLKRTKEI